MSNPIEINNISEDVNIDALRGRSCYDSILKVSSKELTLVLSDTRELDRVPSTE